MATRKRPDPDKVGTHKLIEVVRVKLRRNALADQTDAAHEREINELIKICDQNPLCVVQVYDCKDRYLYTPQGEENDAQILGDAQQAVRDLVASREEI